MSSAAEREYTVEGKTVKLPLEVRDAGSVSATFVVPTRAVRSLISVPRIEVAELWPGRTLCVIAGIEYRENDLGAYNELGVVFFVRGGEGSRIPLVGTAVDMLRGRLGAYIHHLPVTTRFSCEAGRVIWGFPKFVAEIEFREEGGAKACTLRDEGHHVLTLSVRAKPGRRAYPEGHLNAYSGLDCVPRRIPFVSSGEGASLRPGGATLELGSHPIAEELRGLGLPRRALTSARVDHMRMRFEGAEPL
jgi:hypothetical protein